MTFPSTIHLSPAAAAPNLSLSTLGNLFVDKSSNVHISDIGGVARWSGSPNTNGFWTSVTSSPYKMSSYPGYYSCPIGTVYGASYQIPYYATNIKNLHPDWQAGDYLYGYCNSYSANQITNAATYDYSSTTYPITFGAYNTGRAFLNLYGIKYQITQFIYNTTKSQGLIRLCTWATGGNFTSAVSSADLPYTLYAYTSTGTFYNITITGGTTPVPAWSTYWSYVSENNSPLDASTTILYPYGRDPGTLNGL